MSMKRILNILLISCGLIVCNTVIAQSSEDYIVHTIKKGEVLPVLVKKYGITPEEISKINNFGTNHILHVGDKVKLPSNAVYRELPDSVLAAKPASPAPSVPVVKSEVAAKTTDTIAAKTKQPAYTTHIIQHGEVYSVLAKKYHVTVDEILDINDFKGSHILHSGDKIKLPAKAALQQDSTAVVVQPVAQPVAPVVKPEEPVVKKEPVKQPAAIDTTGATAYVVEKKETLYSISKKFKVTVDQLKVWNNLKSNDIATGQTLYIHGIPAATALQNNTPAQQAVTYPQLPQQSEKKIAAPPVSTSSPATKLKPDEKVTPPQKPVADAALANIPETGYFSSVFGKDVTGRSLQTANGVSMTFKTASGWSDKKYYILMNDVAPGSVVQITNEDGKAIYAKVLWNMGDVKDNDGVVFRISDAAASALNLKTTKFNLAVTFYQ